MSFTELCDSDLLGLTDQALSHKDIRPTKLHAAEAIRLGQ